MLFFEFHFLANRLSSSFVFYLVKFTSLSMFQVGCVGFQKLCHFCKSEFSVSEGFEWWCQSSLARSISGCVRLAD